MPSIRDRIASMACASEGVGPACMTVPPEAGIGTPAINRAAACASLAC
ncbi:hypothetical protein [uncultured Methylobacterium sp.]